MTTTASERKIEKGEAGSRGGREDERQGARDGRRQDSSIQLVKSLVDIGHRHRRETETAVKASLRLSPQLRSHGAAQARAHESGDRANIRTETSRDEPYGRVRQRFTREKHRTGVGCWFWHQGRVAGFVECIGGARHGEWMPVLCILPLLE